MFEFSFVCDALDGWFARKFNQVSTFGAVLDMVTDRISTACLLVILSQVYRPGLVFLSLLALDIASHWLQMYRMILAQPLSPVGLGKFSKVAGGIAAKVALAGESIDSCHVTSLGGTQTKQFGIKEEVGIMGSNYNLLDQYGSNLDRRFIGPAPTANDFNAGPSGFGSLPQPASRSSRAKDRVMEEGSTTTRPPLLKNDNYSCWKNRMRNFLRQDTHRDGKIRRNPTNQSHQRNNSDWNVKENPDACYECGRSGHIKKYCPQLKNKTTGSNNRDFKEKKFKSRKTLLTWDDPDESDKEGSEDEDVAQLCFMANEDNPK
ncbi:hypothetical protein RJ640_028919, partial [Escallonia rubra]